MANVSRIFGLRPKGYMNSSEYNGAVNLYGFSASDATAAFKGDPVTIDSTHRSTALSDPYSPGIPLVSATANDMTTTPFRGVIAGFVPAPEYNMTVTASLGTMYRIASTARYCWVVDDYAVIFEVQELGNSYTDATNNGINKAFDVDNSAGGSTITGISGVQIDVPTTSGVKPLRALKLTQRVDNFNFLATDTNSYAKFDVMIANSDLAQANVGA
jgi:hypothetical protein